MTEATFPFMFLGAATTFSSSIPRRPYLVRRWLIGEKLAPQEPKHQSGGLAKWLIATDIERRVTHTVSQVNNVRTFSS